MLERKIPREISFNEWVDYIFNHNDPNWYFVSSSEYLEWEGEDDSDLALEFMTKLFHAPLIYLQKFSEAQISVGLEYITNLQFSSHAFALISKDASLAKKRKCINSMYGLFFEFFSRSLKDILYLSDGIEGRCKLSKICYMWWDILPIRGRKIHPLLEKTLLNTLNKILYIQHIPCIESSLHGLGHWFPYNKIETMRIVDAFLSRNWALPFEIIEYAKKAREGQVE